MPRPSRLLLAIALVLAPLASQPAAMAAEAGSGYTKKPVAVFEAPGDPYAWRVREGLQELGRFHLLTVPTNGIEPLAAFFDRVKTASQASGLGSSPAYVFVPRHAFGHVIATRPRSEHKTDPSTKLTQSTVYAELQCDLLLTVDVYEAATGLRIKQLDNRSTLSRRFEYHYDDNTADTAIRAKANELTTAIVHDAGLPPEMAFGDQARREITGQLGSMIQRVRNLDVFALNVEVTGWDARTDRVFFGIGQDLKVRPDDGFKVFQNGREIGYLKVRQAGPTSSRAQPIFMDGTLRLGDRVVEYAKSNVWQGLKLGMTWMGGPALIGSYTGEADFAPVFGASEFYVTWNAALLNNGLISGAMGELGLAKKFFSRRWGLSVGPRFGVVGLKGLQKDAVTPGGTLSGTLSCYLTPDLIWNTELGMQAYFPIDAQVMGLPVSGSRLINPFGPLLQTGLTYVF